MDSVASCLGTVWIGGLFVCIVALIRIGTFEFGIEKLKLLSGNSEFFVSIHDRFMESCYLNLISFSPWMELCVTVRAVDCRVTVIHRISDFHVI